MVYAYDPLSTNKRFLSFTHEISPENKILEDGMILGLEQFASCVVEKQINEYKINIKEFLLEFHNENEGRIAFYLNYKCGIENFCVADRIQEMAIGII
jgi:hypothetical protein